MWQKWSGLIGLGLILSYSAGVLAAASSALSMEAALKAAQVAVSDCQGKGHAVSAAVVDAGGRLLVLLRSDEAGPHTVDSSYRKAYTALSLRRPTHELARTVAKDPELQALHNVSDDILILGGGLPIRTGGKVVGGIGVGGAPGAMLD
ncbi:MAG: heme-binding protein, partial [Methylohalobius sp.]|nr:heme-binding protein [Methylohalobius sp.]